MMLTPIAASMAGVVLQLLPQQLPDFLSLSPNLPWFLLGLVLAGVPGALKYKQMREQEDETKANTKDSLNKALDLVAGEESESERPTGQKALFVELINEIEKSSMGQQEHNNKLQNIKDAAHNHIGDLPEDSIAFQTMAAFTRSPNEDIHAREVNSAFENLANFSNDLNEVSNRLHEASTVEVPSGHPSSRSEFSGATDLRNVADYLQHGPINEGGIVTECQIILTKFKDTIHNYQAYWLETSQSARNDHSVGGIQSNSGHLSIDEASEIREDIAPESTLAINLLDILSGKHARDGLDTVLGNCVKNLDKFDEWQRKFDHADDSDGIVSRIEEFQSNVEDLPEPAATILRDRSSDIKDLVRPDADGPTRYSADQQLRLLDDISIDFESAVRSAPAEKSDVSDLKEDIDRIHSEYINNPSRSKYNHHIPSKSLQLAGDIVALAESEPSEERTDAFLHAADLIVEWTENLYLKREYNTLLEDM